MTIRFLCRSTICMCMFLALVRTYKEFVLELNYPRFKDETLKGQLRLQNTICAYEREVARKADVQLLHKQLPESDEKDRQFDEAVRVPPHIYIVYPVWVPMLRVEGVNIDMFPSIKKLPG